LVAFTPVAFASPAETEEELLVPVVVEPLALGAPATAPTDVLPPELLDALVAVHTLATLCCSAALLDELDETPEDDEQASPPASAASVD
jgi:hypothetical protein